MTLNNNEYSSLLLLNGKKSCGKKVTVNFQNFQNIDANIL